jgi:hypothetical protein
MRVAAWQRQRLGDADRRRIMEAARRLERLTHRPGLHGGALRRTGIIVLWTLLYRGPSRHGVCDPSIGQLAAWAGCARSTVQLSVLIGTINAWNRLAIGFRSVPAQHPVAAAA